MIEEAALPHSLHFLLQSLLNSLHFYYNRYSDGMKTILPTPPLHTVTDFDCFLSVTAMIEFD